MPAFQYEGDTPFSDSGGIDPATLPTTGIGMTQLADTDYVDLPVYVPDGLTLSVYLWGARTDAQTTPSGLVVSLYDYGAGETVASSNTELLTAADVEDDALTTLEGPTDASLRITNSTGGELNAGGIFGFQIA